MAKPYSQFLKTTVWFTSKGFWVRVLKKWHDKLDHRAVRCVLLGYSRTQRISMLESRHQEVYNLCGCHFLWKHTLKWNLFRFQYNSFDHYSYSSCTTRRLASTLSLSTMQEDYHWSWQLTPSSVNYFHWSVWTFHNSSKRYSFLYSTSYT